MSNTLVLIFTLAVSFYADYWKTIQPCYTISTHVTCIIQMFSQSCIRTIFKNTTILLKNQSLLK